MVGPSLRKSSRLDPAKRRLKLLGFSNPNKVNKIINGSANTNHKWELLVPDKNPNDIADIIKEALEYGITTPYKPSASSKVLSVTRNGQTHVVEVPFVYVDGKINFGDAWIR